MLPTNVVAGQYRIRHALHSAARMARPYAQSWCGHVVLCDRHPIEHEALAESITGVLGSLERVVSRCLVPWPDLVVLLDAPGQVLFDRKGEHSAALLDSWRHRYRAILEPRGAKIVSTEGPPHESIAEVAALVWRVLEDRRGW